MPCEAGSSTPLVDEEDDGWSSNDPRSQPRPYLASCRSAAVCPCVCRLPMRDHKSGHEWKQTQANTIEQVYIRARWEMYRVIGHMVINARTHSLPRLPVLLVLPLPIPILLVPIPILLIKTEPTTRV
jgi:hypothetical protein